MQQIVLIVIPVSIPSLPGRINILVRMTFPLNAIFFDMDDTLFDFAGAQITACRAVAEFFGRSDGDRLFRDYFQSSVRGYESYENILDYMHDHALPDNGIYEQACRVYEQVKLDFVTPYDGVRETLSFLQDAGYPMAVITDAHSRDAVRRLEKTGLLPHFTGVVAFDMVRIKKPAPAPFLTALDMMKTDPENAVLIGDSPQRDIRPAHDLGIRTVYARYGDRLSPEQQCPDADYVIDGMEELIAIIRQMPSGREF